MAVEGLSHRRGEERAVGPARTILQGGSHGETFSRTSGLSQEDDRTGRSRPACCGAGPEASRRLGGWCGGQNQHEDGIRSRGEVRDQGERGRVPAHAGRAAADGPHLSTEWRGTVPHRARSARRRVERQRPPRGGTDGPRVGGQRRAGGRHRHDAGAGSAVPGVRSGRQLRRALAQIESGLVERRPVEDRRVRKLQRRPRRRAPGHAPARCALQRDSPARGAERRCDGGLRRDALADQRPVRALPERGEDEARQHDQEPHDLLQSVGHDLRSQSAADPRAPRGGHAGAAADHAGRARRQRAPGRAGEIRRDVQGGRRRLPIPRVRGLRTRVGRHTGAANRPRPRDGQGVHRAPIEASEPTSASRGTAHRDSRPRASTTRRRDRPPRRECGGRHPSARRAWLRPCHRT